jgi:hypothetical protein
MPLEPRPRLGSYEIVSVLGRGGMGRVLSKQNCARRDSKLSIATMPSPGLPDGRSLADIG